ncbi:hypothetical protein F511_17546 [Dorcoceras hygrometricum]|uniref:Uncharacterized protein n=1 Tax=Dorcoceras hygrometricum TaxID=472368 RepID=A0A2Z7CX42_9LAMI|nr:hypothetical protein F511_17546 [Dorcoceras hygrometricum]
MAHECAAARADVHGRRSLRAASATSRAAAARDFKVAAPPAGRRSGDVVTADFF